MLSPDEKSALKITYSSGMKNTIPSPSPEIFTCAKALKVTSRRPFSLRNLRPLFGRDSEVSQGRQNRLDSG